MGFRQDVAAALSTVDGVAGYAHRPTMVRPGDAWPLLKSLDRDAGMTFIRTWRVLVLLPGDEAAGIDWVDQHAEALAVALDPVGFVDQMVPGLLELAGNQTFALEITMRSESG